MKKHFLIITVIVLLLSLTACRPDPDTQMQPPEPGYYILSSVSDGENITFLSSIDPTNGYVLLEADHTGMMRWGDVEQELSWNNQSIHWGDDTIPCMYVTSEEPEMELEAAMLLLIFEDEKATAIFRPVEG